MRRFALVLGLVSTLAGCGRSDVAIDPGDGYLVRQYMLDDGDSVWVEYLVEDDVELRDAVLDIEDGLELEDLCDELAMGEPYELVLETAEEVLIVEVEGEQLAWIWGTSPRQH
jgi:hypothetical protein